MKVEVQPEGLKIILPRYKITSKKLKTSSGNTVYQHSCVLPPLLCSFFNVQKNTKDGQLLQNRLLFYMINGTGYIMSSELYSDVSGLDSNQEGVNVQLLDQVVVGIRNQEVMETSAYKVYGRDSYRITLPSPIFKDRINPDEDNYIRFIIDTTEEDVLYNKGVVKYTVETV